MSKKYERKLSLTLRLCKALAFFLFLVVLVSYVLMYFDLDLVLGMSEERKDGLLSSRSFQTAVRLTDEISKNTNKYGKVENIEIIKYLTSTSIDILGEVNTGYYLSVHMKNGDIFYFRFLRGFEEVDSKTYSDAKGFTSTKVQSNETIFSNAEIKYLKEVLKQNNIDDLLYEFKKNEVKSKKYWTILNRALFGIDTNEYSSRVNYVCVGSLSDDESETDGIVVKIGFENGENLYYISYDRRLMPTNEDMFQSRSKYKTYFYEYEIEVYYKEVGGTWH